MTIKAVFFDVDGTLLSFRNHQVPASTITAIEQLKKKGVKIFVSTGRSINSIQSIKHIDFDGFITFNGGYCVANNGEVLFRKSLDAGDVSAVIQYAETHPSFCFSFMSEKDITINRINPEILSMYDMVNLPPPAIGQYTDFDCNSVLQTNIFIPPDEEPLFMESIMPNSIATRWTPLFADVNPREQSKKVGVEVFCDYYGIDRAETMAFGDGGNDVEMLKYCGIGVAMGNAVDELKKIADYTTQDVDDDGIAQALHFFQVI